MSTESAQDQGPPTKDCPKARIFEVHPPHVWFKKPDTADWPFWCDGILPEDQRPPCQVYISPAQPECGEPAVTTIHVKTRLIDARIDVCPKHKHEYDDRSAKLRGERRGRSSSQSFPKAS